MIGSDQRPRVVWSLDFELRWGMHDHLGMDRNAYLTNLEGEREAVPQFLNLFVQRGVRATWATVGALACNDWDEYFRLAPPPPSYADSRLAFDPRYADLDPDGVLHFAPDLVRLVSQTKGQDLGTHTFSHIFLSEMGVMQKDVQADHAALTGLFRERLNTTPTSLVFPRNQVAFLSFYRANGITAWRDNERSWYLNQTKYANHPVLRALRLADALTPFWPRGGRFSEGGTTSTLFVRVTLPEIAWKTHLAKVATEVRHMGRDSVLHFWLHPHNVGGNLRRGMARIVQVLDTIDKYAPKGTLYASMRDLVMFSGSHDSTTA
jgi:peptidoglycan/xylan/chitin deacetylase (PgdA/CDA1 family)